VTTTLGACSFDMEYTSIVIGTATSNSGQLTIVGSPSGTNNAVTLSGDFNQSPGGSTLTAIEGVISNYINKQPTPMKLVGSNLPNPEPLQQALEKTTISATMPGLTANIVPSGSLDSWSLSCCFDVNMKVYVQIYNPTAVSLTVNSITATCYANGNNLGTCTGSNLGTFAPGQQAQSANTVGLSTGISFSLFGDLISGSVDVTIQGSASLTISGFTVVVSISLVVPVST